jgi:hypothetical protein
MADLSELVSEVRWLLASIESRAGQVYESRSANDLQALPTEEDSDEGR